MTVAKQMSAHIEFACICRLASSHMAVMVYADMSITYAEHDGHAAYAEHDGHAAYQKLLQLMRAKGNKLAGLGSPEDSPSLGAAEVGCASQQAPWHYHC